MLKDIIEKAVLSNDAEFSALIRNVLSIQKKERSDAVMGDLIVNEGLVRMVQRHRLILVGDLHGDLQSLAVILQKSNFLGDLSSRIIFLGDYGDRGQESVEVYYVILYLKSRFSDRVILMRGNHEGPSDMPFYPHDLPEQILGKFGSVGNSIYQALRSLFDVMYHAVLFENSYLILHAGVPTSFSSINHIATANKTHPNTRYLEEILWNDPREIKGSEPSGRGYGKYFGKDITEQALKITNTKALIRAHEPCNGFKLDHDGLVLTLFSCKAPYGNMDAAYLEINRESYNLTAEDLAKIVELI
ncbi:MAG: metallophosphoesterase family protein [Nitrososphaerales archaeon]